MSWFIISSPWGSLDKWKHSSMSAEWVSLLCLALIWNLEVSYFYSTSKATTCSSSPFLKTKKSLGLRRNVWDLNLLCFKSQRLNQNLNCPYVLQVRRRNWWESYLGQSNRFTINHKVLFILTKKKSDHWSIPIANISCPQSYSSSSLHLCYIPRRAKYYLLLLWLGYRYILYFRSKCYLCRLFP